MNISVFNGGGQTDYMYGLVSGLAAASPKPVFVLDSDVNALLFHENKTVKYKTVLHALPRNSSALKKALNMMRFYLFQAWHLLIAPRGIAHFQWLDRYYIPDRILLPLWARLMGFKVVLTVHNVNSKKRDNRDTMINRFTLNSVYRIAHRLIVHTPLSKDELIKEFGVNADKIAVIRHGTNNKVTITGVDQPQARRALGFAPDQKIILFFGNIDYYKGVDLLTASLGYLSDELKESVHLVIAGFSKSSAYMNQLSEVLAPGLNSGKISAHIRHIPDAEVETYFMAADCIVLPYRNIYQSGVIFMAYTFGLPVIVPNIGNFSNDIHQGLSGFLAASNQPADLATAIEKYYDSEAYLNLPETREAIKQWAHSVYGWESIGKDTLTMYESIH